ncbi:tyrosine-type recombinase/integrase [Algiphilus aromaticivorans]|uniref:tyrosine-type recombinase/integrase n=1 Tax=Algiphilus aromaticivorans TaxID=382454 RepID=UPI0005C233F9|nr:site-specific integrase [Algiphilus aromaticivorans]
MQKKKRGPTPTGYVSRRGNGKYQAQIMINGQRYTETFRDEGSAEQYLKDMQVGVRRPDLLDEIVATRRFTLREVVEKRLDEIQGSEKSAAQARSALRQVLVKAPELAELRMRDILVRDIEKLVERRKAVGEAPRTINGLLSRISTSFEWAATHGDRELRNVALEAKWMPVPKPGDPDSFIYQRLDSEQETALIEAAEILRAQRRTCLEFSSLIRLALDTTMRRGELAKLDWEDIDWDRRTLLVRNAKNGSSRIVPLRGSTLRMLERLSPCDSGRVWAAPSTISRAWRKTRALAAEILQSAGKVVLARNLKTIRFHDLRFEGICRLFEDLDLGLTEREIAGISGHDSPEMLWHYSRNLNKSKVAEKFARAEGENWSYKPASAKRRPRAIAIRMNPDWRRFRDCTDLLEQAVWSMPIRDFAEDMGISDVAVHRACKRLGVRKPPKGYWIQREHRKAA